MWENRNRKCFAYLDGVELAAVPAVGCVLGAVQDRLLLASVRSDVAVLKLCWWLDEARAFDHGEDVRLVVAGNAANPAMSSRSHQVGARDGLVGVRARRASRRVEASGWWSALAQRVRSHARRWPAGVGPLRVAIVLVLRVHLELLDRIMLIFCGKRPLSLALDLGAQLIHRRVSLLKGLLLLRVRLVLLDILCASLKVVPRQILRLIRDGPVAAQRDPLVDAVVLQVICGLLPLRLLDHRSLLLVLELLLEELLVLLVDVKIAVARGLVVAVGERLHIHWIAEAFVVTEPRLCAVGPEHEAGVQLAGLRWRSHEVLRLDDEVVVGDLLLDGVDEVVLLQVWLAARLCWLPNHHAQTVAVPRVRLEGLGIFEVDVLSAVVGTLGPSRQAVALDRPQVRLLPRRARSKTLVLLLELSVGLLSHLQIHLLLLHRKLVSYISISLKS